MTPVDSYFVYLFKVMCFDDYKRYFCRESFGSGVRPCDVVWSNAHRINPAVADGKCIAFSAMSTGEIFVVFSAIPIDENTWYYVQINSKGVFIYKVCLTTLCDQF